MPVHTWEKLTGNRWRSPASTAT